MSSASVEVEIQLGRTAPAPRPCRCRRRPREEVPPWQRGAGTSLPATRQLPLGARGGDPRPCPAPRRREAAGGSHECAPAAACPPCARALELRVCDRETSLKLTRFPVRRCDCLVRAVCTWSVTAQLLSVC